MIVKKTIERKLEKGIVVNIAGNTINVRSGPFNGSSSILIFVSSEIWHINVKNITEANNPHITVKIGMK